MLQMDNESNSNSNCLTAVIWSDSFVVAHLERVEDGRDVHVAKTSRVAEMEEFFILTLFVTNI